MKTCFNCKLIKPLTDFCKNVSKKDGLQGRCRECNCAQYFLTRKPLRYPRPVAPKGCKYCFRCKTIKNVVEFCVSSARRDGRQNYCRACCSVLCKDQRVKNLSAHKARYRLRTYGLANEDYLRMLKEQKSSCAICGCADRKLCVDHDHITGKVRALLCHKCNYSIAGFGESPMVVESALTYLLKHGK